MKKSEKRVPTYDDNKLSKKINLRKIFELIFRILLPKPAKIPIPIPTEAEKESEIADDW